nr:MAG TPA: hypothetical protein [Caudoviricetes sp.]
MKKIKLQNGKEITKYEKSDLSELKNKKVGRRPFKIWRSQLDLSEFSKEDRNIFIKFLKSNDNLIDPEYGFIEFNRFNFRKEEVKDEVDILMRCMVKAPNISHVKDDEIQSELYGKLRNFDDTFEMGYVKLKGIKKRFQGLIKIVEESRCTFYDDDIYTATPSVYIYKWGTQGLYGWQYDRYTFSNPYALYEKYKSYGEPRLYNYNDENLSPLQSFGVEYKDYDEIEEIINKELKEGYKALLENNKDFILSEIQKIKKEMDDLVSEYAKKSEEKIKNQLIESEKEVDDFIANFESLEEVKIASKDNATYDEVREVYGDLPYWYIHYNHLGNYTFYLVATEYELKKVLVKNGTKYDYEIEVSKWKKVFENPYDGIEEDYEKYKKWDDEMESRDTSYGRAAFRHMLGNME